MTLDVGIDSEKIIKLLSITPKPSTIEETISEIRSHFNWLCEQASDSDIMFLAFSGEADPDIWNKLEKDIRECLDAGMRYTHVVGPVVCTDDNGESSILDFMREYPDQVEIYLSRLRQLYHWNCFTALSSLKYRLRGENYHDPLSENRKHFTIFYEKEDDKYASMKQYYWRSKINSFESIKPILEKVEDSGEIPLVTKSDLKKAYKNARRRRIPTELLNINEINQLLRNF